MYKLFNETIIKGVFPGNLKLAAVTPVFKKDDPFDKETTDLSAFYRLYLRFKKLTQGQINNYIRNHLSPYLCWHRKSFNNQQGLVSLIEKWRRF